MVAAKDFFFNGSKIKIGQKCCGNTSNILKLLVISFNCGQIFTLNINYHLCMFTFLSFPNRCCNNCMYDG